MPEPGKPEFEASGERPKPPVRGGDIVTHYKIVSEIGRGGMGIVYHAIDLSLGRDVAMKCAWPDRAADPFLRKRMLREARATSRVLHPNIVPVLEAFEDRGILWLVMEKVEGVSLRERLRTVGPLPPLEVVHCGEGLADALGAAHRKGVLHRDVTPGNVLLAAEGRPRLTDFGLVRFFLPEGHVSEPSTESSSLTTEGRIVGTFPYMSPEQILGKTVDPRSDLFSLGAVLYHACAGVPPFPGAARGELLDAILHREPTSLSRLNYAVPEELERIIRKAMAKRPDERYQSAPEMVADLRAVRRRLESLEFLSTQEEYVPRARSRRSTVITAAASAGIAAAVLIIAGIWYVASHRAPSPVPTGRPVQLTSAPGWEAEPAISPSGEFVAYASNQSGNPDIWISDTHGGSSLQLTRDPSSESSPAWFPDSSALAFVSDRGGTAGIWKMPRFPGPAVLLVPDAYDPAISPDGRRMAFAAAGGDGHLRIKVAELGALGQPAVLTTASDGLWDQRNPAWSPDGSSIVYEAFRDLWLIPRADGSGSVAGAFGKPRPLTSDHECDRKPSFSSDGRYVYFSSYREGGKALWRVPVSGGAALRMTLGTGPEDQPSINRKGSRLAYSTYAGASNLAVLDRGPEGPVVSRAGAGTAGRHLWPAPASAGFPTLDRSGSALYYTAEHSGSGAIWIQNLLTGRPRGEPTPIFEQPGIAGSFALSGDGRTLVYYLIKGSTRNLWTVSSSGGIPVQLTEGSGQCIHPALSPDGRSLAFISDRGGALQVWTMPMRDGHSEGPAARLTSDSRTDLFPEWSPDGATIAFTRNDKDTSEVWTIAKDGHAPPRRWTSGAGARRVRWDPLEGGLLVSGAWGADRVEIRRVASPGAEAVPLVPPVVFGDAQSLGDFSLTANGRTVALIEEDRRGDIWVLEARPGTF